MAVRRQETGGIKNEGFKQLSAFTASALSLRWCDKERAEEEEFIYKLPCEGFIAVVVLYNLERLAWRGRRRSHLLC